MSDRRWLQQPVHTMAGAGGPGSRDNPSGRHSGTAAAWGGGHLHHRTPRRGQQAVALPLPARALELRAHAGDDDRLPAEKLPCKDPAAQRLDRPGRRRQASGLQRRAVKTSHRRGTYRRSSPLHALSANSPPASGSGSSQRPPAPADPSAGGVATTARAAATASSDIISGISRAAACAAAAIMAAIAAPRAISTYYYFK